jgi:hypothetical protein
MGVSQVLVKLLLLALNLMPVDQAGFNFHILEDGRYVAGYRAEKRDEDFTVFRPAAGDGDAKFPAFDAERSRRFGRTYMVRVRETGEMLSVDLTMIMMDMPALSLVPRQILREGGPESGDGERAGAGAEAGAGSGGTDTGAAQSSGAAGGTDGDSSGDIIIDGAGRTLFLTASGQNLTIVAEVNAPL